MQYKGYIPHIWFEPDDRAFHGHVVGTRDLIHFTGTSVDELEREFRESVDIYLEWCTEDGVEPDVAYTGEIELTVSPELHRRMAGAATRAKVPLDRWIRQVIESELARQELPQAA